MDVRNDPRWLELKAADESERVQQMSHEEQCRELRAMMERNGLLRDWIRCGFASAFESLSEETLEVIHQQLLAALLVPGLPDEDFPIVAARVLAPYGVEPHEGCWWVVSPVDLSTKQDA